MPVLAHLRVQVPANARLVATGDCTFDLLAPLALSDVA